jgi:murein DD-endopeptidase MepM/ murein hydrolase activator NlpD
MRKLVVVLLGLLVVLVCVYVAAGSAAGPVVQIQHPDRFVGASTPVDVAVDAPGGVLSALTITFEQAGTTTPLLSMDERTAAPLMKSNGGDRVGVTSEITRKNVPHLKVGPARIVVTASRPVLYGLRHVETTVARDVTVRLEKPSVAVVSTKHYINLGGSEMIVYRATPADVVSGVKVGDVEYPGYPASGLNIEGVKIADPAVHVAFFALLYDQPLHTPMRLFARDEAGNAAESEFDHRTFPKKFKSSKIELTDALLDRVVPAILSATTEISPQGSTIEKFLVINGELRRKNAATIAALAAKTAPDMLWRGVVFHPFTNDKVEAAFADFRTYFYKGREVDKQVHLGFDLASYANTPIVAANRGTVVYAADLGIYGNCVIIDHGLGVQSLYAHLSSIAVKPGATVEKDQAIGRSGMTGIAGGDHLHFTMLVNGHPVNPLEWWDAHWIEDRILRKQHEAR